jgi:DNA processing protein
VYATDSSTVTIENARVDLHFIDASGNSQLTIKKTRFYTGGGGMITASLALELGKEVFAVPGRITNWQSEGPHALIKDGAVLVESGDEVVEHLYGGIVVSESEKEEDGVEMSFETEEQEIVYRVLLESDGALSFEEIKVRTGLDDDRLTVALVELEMNGMVKRTVPFGYQVV